MTPSRRCSWSTPSSPGASKGCASRGGRCCFVPRITAPASGGGTRPAATSLREVRRPQVLEAAHVGDVLVLMRFAQNPRDRVSGFRAMQLLAGIGPKIARASSTTWARCTAWLRAARRAAAARRCARLAGLRRAARERRRPLRPLAIEPRRPCASGMEPRWNASSRTPRYAVPTSISWSASARPTQAASASHRPHARPARRHQRRGRRAAARRGLPHPSTIHSARARNGAR